MVAAQASSLRDAVNQFNDTFGEIAISDFEQASSLVLSWIDYFENTLTKDVCDELLVATRAAQIEAAACLAVGMVRAAIVAQRLQFELFFAWIYFNDHHIEWNSVKRGESDFPMRKQNILYLEKYNPNYKTRFSLACTVAGRNHKEPYKILSNFVHGSSIAAMPSFGNLTAVIQDEQAMRACIGLQADISEYLSDVAASWLADRWHDLPTAAKQNLSTRLGQARLSQFCR